MWLFRTLVPAVTAGVVTVMMASTQVLACTFHMTSFGSIFEPTYPGSLSVVAAVANARSEERLGARILESGDAGLLRASHELNKLGRRLNRLEDHPKSDFYVIFAGQQLWTYYRASKFSARPTYQVHVHTAAPHHEVPVLVTSYYVVEAFQEGRLTYEQALEAGLVQVRNDDQDIVSALFSRAF